MTEQHRVAVVVTVTAEGEDYGDALNVAELAVHSALPPGTVRDYRPGDRDHYAGPIVRQVRVEDVLEIGRAARNGYLTIRPARTGPEL